MKKTPFGFSEIRDCTKSTVSNKGQKVEKIVSNTLVQLMLKLMDLKNWLASFLTNINFFIF
jgi:hypothetical protein